MKWLTENRLFLPGCLVLALGIGVGFASLINSDFVTYDDPTYVTKNGHVQGGLALRGIAWAFTTGHGGNWHPLTWISHMLDCQLYGLKPGGHHFTSLLFHVANTLLLFGLLRRMTGAFWRSAIVAALFAWHPLHVESVAWIAERKDVLSAFFFLLTLWAYVDGIKNEKLKIKNYLLALLFFALGLMSKPMLVTTPFVLLLLDYWPLKRDRKWPPLILEKIPFFVLAMVSSIVTFLAQQRGGAVMSLGALPFRERAANALIAYVSYLRKTAWPDDLAVFYPMSESFPAWQIAGAIIFLAAVTIAVALVRRQRGYLLVGWLWFLGTLVPVIGLVQVGFQAMADRYTYIPLVGIFIMLVWGIADLSVRWPRRACVLCGMTTLALAACLVQTWFQARTWQNTVTLFTHDLAVAGDNLVAHDNLGTALDKIGRTEEGIVHLKLAAQLAPDSPFPFPLNNLGWIYARDGKSDIANGYYQAALRNNPDFSPAHVNLAALFVSQKRWEEAAFHYQQSLRAEPDEPDVHYRLGDALVRLNKLDEALNHFQTALRLKPDFPEVESQIGGVLHTLGKLDAALHHYAEAARLKPDYAHAHLNQGVILAQQAQYGQASLHLLRAIQLEPTNGIARYNLACVFASQGRFNEAATAFAEVIRLKPDDADARERLGAVLEQSGNFAAAIGQYREMIRFNPDSVEALRALAAILATNPNAALRNGAEAVRLAERANELTGHADPRMLTALDEAYAEAGRFEDAIKIAQQAKALAISNRQPALAEEAARRLESYRLAKPHRE